MRISILKWAIFLCVMAIAAKAQINEIDQNSDWVDLNLKAIELKRQGNWEGALNLFEKARAKAENQFGINHLNYASSLDNLAITYHHFNSIALRFRSTQSLF